MKIEFSACSSTFLPPTVMEGVVQSSFDPKQDATSRTIRIVPWKIDDAADLALYFRFLHTAMDAKSKLGQAIYQEPKNWQ